MFLNICEVWHVRTLFFDGEGASTPRLAHPEGRLAHWEALRHGHVDPHQGFVS
jgi:hypothetical protein